MISIPGWLAAAGISLAVILLGNFIQSMVEGYRERRRDRKQWYEATAALVNQIREVYERRREVARQRRSDSEDLPEVMSSGVKREIREEMLSIMADLNEHARTEIEVDDEVSNGIDRLDREVIRLKREGVDRRIDDVIDVCHDLEAESRRAANQEDSWLL
jgi:seryl-tRNA synthetase